MKDADSFPPLEKDLFWSETNPEPLYSKETANIPIHPLIGSAEVAEYVLNISSPSTQINLGKKWRFQIEIRICCLSIRNIFCSTVSIQSLKLSWSNVQYRLSTQRHTLVVSTNVDAPRYDEASKQCAVELLEWSITIITFNNKMGTYEIHM